jgi:F-type H+-transporting ATPase subunit delta
MARQQPARRFAQAAFQIAQEADQLAEWRQDLTNIAQALENEELTTFLDSPQVPVKAKLKVLDEVLGDGVGPLPRNLVGLLASRSAVAAVPEIVDQFEAMLDAHQGVVRADVTTAVKLTADQVTALTKTLGEVVGADVKVETRVDPAVLGGMVARVGDRVIDGSLRTKLQAMKREISQ